ncbi:MAG: RnfABCDGE type electron transport complex subunit D [Myxococcota bacterium]|nr:RnfABCDGE type electron transport complex subunit D [Myxococcota bacterium]
MTDPATPTSGGAPAAAAGPALAPELIVSSSPHVATPDSVPRIMRSVWLSLLPACAVAAWFFGRDALVVIGVTVLGCVVCETLFLKARGRSWTEARAAALDGSAVVTGVLLALNLPAGSPWWMLLVGAFVAMFLGKHVFGGLGCNPFNPALVARVFLLIAFPAQMLTWSAPVERFAQSTEERIAADMHELDGLTYATPLGKLKQTLRTGADPTQVARIRAQMREQHPTLDLFLGRHGGSLGEVSVLALLLGAAFLLLRRIITWHIPLSFIGATAAITAPAWALKPDVHVDPLYHLFSGGLILGAFFMATDMVTSPVTRKGMLIFGAGCGAITAVIRLWGAYPEGVSFAILIMNALVPILDRHARDRRFGEARRRAAA